VKLKNLTISGMTMSAATPKGYVLHADHRGHRIFAGHYPKSGGYNAAIHGKGKLRWLPAEQAERLWDELFRRTGEHVHDARWS
jgi:hypothetical protein